MVARALRGCSLDLGDESELLGSPDQLRQQTKRAQQAEECVAALENSLTLRSTGPFRKPLAARRRGR